MIKNILILQIDATFTASLLLHGRLLKLKPNEVLYRQDDVANESIKMDLRKKLKICRCFLNVTIDLCYKIKTIK